MYNHLKLKFEKRWKKSSTFRRNLLAIRHILLSIFIVFILTIFFTLLAVIFTNATFNILFTVFNAVFIAHSIIGTAIFAESVGIRSGIFIISIIGFMLFLSNVFSYLIVGEISIMKMYSPLICSNIINIFILATEKEESEFYYLRKQEEKKND